MLGHRLLLLAVFSTTSGLQVNPSATKKEIELTTSSSTDPLSVPIQFHQKLLVCNAVPADGKQFAEGVSVSRNSAPVKSHEALGFNECRYIGGKIRKDDRLNFVFEKESVQGVFEVDELPNADSVLLVIVQKRPEKNSDLLSFQSFAFAPASAETAQVAFLNAISGDSETRVRMRDSAQGGGKSVREEQLLLNRVYAIEEGDYNVSLLSHKDNQSHLQLRSGQDYVVLKTGTKDHPNLIVFPSGPTESRLISVLYLMAFMGPLIALALAFSFAGKKKDSTTDSTADSSTKEGKTVTLEKDDENTISSEDAMSTADAVP